MGNVKDRITDIKDNFTGALGTLRGKTIEDNVSEYTEIYGEVLLGMHRDLETYKRQVAEYRDESNKNKDRIEEIYKDMKRSLRGLIIWKVIAIASLLLSFSFGVLFWIS